VSSPYGRKEKRSSSAQACDYRHEAAAARAFFAVTEERVWAACGAQIAHKNTLFGEAASRIWARLALRRSSKTFFGGGWWPGGIMSSHCSGFGVFSSV
jgi:hypothetical protein